jgi:hypothetical protein
MTGTLLECVAMNFYRLPMKPICSTSKIMSLKSKAYMTGTLLECVAMNFSGLPMKPIYSTSKIRSLKCKHYTTGTLLACVAMSFVPVTNEFSALNRAGYTGVREKPYVLVLSVKNFRSGSMSPPSSTAVGYRGIL